MPEPPIVPADPAALANRIVARAQTGPRVIVGIAGAPGSGKSFLAHEVADIVRERTTAVVVPMDGFHLSNAILAEHGSAGRKGAIDTFDAGGYAATIARIRGADSAGGGGRAGRAGREVPDAGEREVVYVPGFDHRVGEPIAASVAVEPETRVVITEGNYLLVPSGPWLAARTHG